MALVTPGVIGPEVPGAIVPGAVVPDVPEVIAPGVVLLPLLVVELLLPLRIDVPVVDVEPVELVIVPVVDGVCAPAAAPPVV